MCLFFGFARLYWRARIETLSLWQLSVSRFCVSPAFIGGRGLKLYDTIQR